MKTSFRTSALALIVTLVVSSAAVVQAAPPVATLLAPPQQSGNFLPKFGFRSYNLGGVGEVVTHVQWGGLAWKMGLQKGDIIRTLNHMELAYHGAWSDALRHALFNNGGQVHLQIIDRNTGLVAHRQVSFGGFGNYGTPYVVGYGGQQSSYLINNGPNYGGPNYGGDYCYDDNYGYPTGPITQKSVVGPQANVKKHNGNQQLSIGQIVKMFDKD
jgi:hypothetical protein